MTLVNRAMTAAFDVIGGLLSLFPPVGGIVIVSLATALLMLLVVRLTSNQRGIRTAKAGMAAALFEIRLFNDDLVNIARAQLSALRHLLSYWRATLVPVLWLAVPLTLTVAQLDAFYGHAPIPAGRSILLTVALRDEPDPAAIRLEAPNGIEIETPAICFASDRQVVWRLKPVSVGTFAMHVHVGAQDFVKTVAVPGRATRVSPQRVSSGFVDELRYPSELPLPADSAVRSITLAYDRADVDAFGWRMPWLVLYTILSLVFALLLRKPFRVTF